MSIRKPIGRDYIVPVDSPHAVLVRQVPRVSLEKIVRWHNIECVGVRLIVEERFGATLGDPIYHFTIWITGQ